MQEERGARASELELVRIISTENKKGISPNFKFPKIEIPKNLQTLNACVKRSSEKERTFF